MRVLKHLHLMYFVFFFLFHQYSGANVSPGAHGYMMYLHGGEKKEEKEGTQVKNKNTGHVCCSDAFEKRSREEETTVSSQYSQRMNAVSAHAANMMLFLG